MIALMLRAQVTNEESVSVSTTNNIGLAHLGDPLLLVFLKIFL